MGNQCVNLEDINVKESWIVSLDFFKNGPIIKLKHEISTRHNSFPARQNSDSGRNFTYFLLIFRLFSAYGTPSAVFKPRCLLNSPISTYFCLFSAYFPPIFHLKWYPILVINSSMEPICCFSTHMFLDSAYFPLIFRLTCPFCPYSAGPVLPGYRIHRRIFLIFINLLNPIQYICSIWM